jgi:hypothetical protein
VQSLLPHTPAQQAPAPQLAAGQRPCLFLPNPPPGALTRPHQFANQGHDACRVVLRACCCQPTVSTAAQQRSTHLSNKPGEEFHTSWKLHACGCAVHLVNGIPDTTACMSWPWQCRRGLLAQHQLLGSGDAPQLPLSQPIYNTHPATPKTLPGMSPSTHSMPYCMRFQVAHSVHMCVLYTSHPDTAQGACSSAASAGCTTAVNQYTESLKAQAPLSAGDRCAKTQGLVIIMAARCMQALRMSCTSPTAHSLSEVAVGLHAGHCHTHCGTSTPADTYRLVQPRRTACPSCPVRATIHSAGCHHTSHHLVVLASHRLAGLTCPSPSCSSGASRHHSRPSCGPSHPSHHSHPSRHGHSCGSTVARQQHTVTGLSAIFGQGGEDAAVAAQTKTATDDQADTVLAIIAGMAAADPMQRCP